VSNDALLIRIAILGLIALTCVLVVVVGTLRKTRWGISRESHDCPKCAALLPRRRVPENLRQIFWGGWTCGACGAEVDKYGNVLVSPSVHP
jgi:hypothetical protein